MKLIIILYLLSVSYQKNNDCDKSLICGLKRIDNYIECLKNEGYNGNNMIEALYFDFLNCSNYDFLKLEIDIQKISEKLRIEKIKSKYDSKTSEYENLFENIRERVKKLKIDKKMTFKCLLYIFELVLIQKLNLNYQNKLKLLFFALFLFYIDSPIRFDCLFSILLLLIVKIY